MLLPSSPIFDFVDAIATTEGDAIIDELAQNIKTGETSRKMPGLLTAATAPETKLPAFKKLSSTPTPNFDDLDLNAYLSPDIVFPILTFKGCSYGKCTFCDHHVNYQRLSARPAEKVIGDIQVLKQKYSARYFNFVDEELPPNHARGIINSIQSHELQIRWMGYAIYRNDWTNEDVQGLYDAGCRELLFGFESAVHRILDLMQKDIDVDWVISFTKKLNAVGISSRINVIIGFPGETASEAQQTFDYFKDNAATFGVESNLVAFHPFLLVGNSPLAKAPHDGLTVNSAGKGRSLLNFSYSVVDDKALNSDQAFALAHEFASRLEEVYSKNTQPLWRLHRFLYACNQDKIRTEKKQDNYVETLSTQVTALGFPINEHQEKIEKLVSASACYDALV